MSSQTKHKAGVLGAGSFGTTVSTLLAHNSEVLLYTRRQEVVNQINKEGIHLGIKLSSNIKATTDLEAITSECNLIFPIVPSENFRPTLKRLSPFLNPGHILIHGTKGLDLSKINIKELASMSISRKDIHTMSEVMRQETCVSRVGCLAGPNLYKEILQGQPTACVIASEFDEVIKVGSEYLASKYFFVFGSYDLVGAEMAGALKNIIALAAGMLFGKGLGKNIQAMLITRGLREMIELGRAMGATHRSFLGTAGIGDLIATATSENSRNFQFGYRFSKGESLDQIISSMDETVEGLRTTRIAYQLAKNYQIRVPIIQMIFSVLFEGIELEKAIQFLMRYPYLPDVDFI
ncbi:MAG: NAD(P)-dependent glycerol-3-phosphate dehydrogenase [Saprospiraceae bacterium]|nr:NAD(P)-dependent glycerol-3-phosphate dehydrogenase [Saprospiraceae bacterium]MBK7812155.1 NAD(P)-dependent glycerol-3-phosphate dehydrogenase [Saprospiraceae bacterium]MBK9632629.1 NAD(P)-dependent glycerol-3-phosphate dehydrogenase [Saprospiraceae bacterium]